ncbi:uncharacterized protein LOC118439396 [Folsomia candida]|uniref:uncharacterized protein LOC118439396 n=1 Tax=Folsomia candida TaxID=158441 RepID=UPI0016051347|nr:uncharacterized protein LOC118439396 [Folsomia candida]
MEFFSNVIQGAAKLVGDLLSNKPDFTEDILVIIPPKGKKSVGVDQLLSLTKRSPPQCLDLHRLGIYARLHGLPTELKSPLLKKFRDKDSSKHEKLVLAQILKYCAKKESTKPFLSTTEVSNLLQSLETTNSTPTINDDPYDPDLFFNLGTRSELCLSFCIILHQSIVKGARVLEGDWKILLYYESRISNINTYEGNVHILRRQKISILAHHFHLLLVFNLQWNLFSSYTWID